MATGPVIAVDAMGGDFAPRAVVEGAVAAARRLGLRLCLAGQRAALDGELARHSGRDAPGLDVVDASDVIGMDEPPAAALRRKPDASIRVAMGLVAGGRAAGVVSAGSTGATVMAARTMLGLVPGVERPALAVIVPTRRQPAVLLDAGANAACRPAHLVQFGVMGSVFAQVALGLERPRVGLLSTGEEASKGTTLTREAHQRLLVAPVHFVGNVEARDVYAGVADVIVCDGFTGNVALKISESLVDMVTALAGPELAARLGRLDASEYGGALLVGVGGVVVVGHGRSTARAVERAIELAHRFAVEGLVTRLERGIAAIPVSAS